jgi:perosamine synthetase
MIPIYKPYLSKYKSSAINAINSEWISNHGIYVDLATDKLKEIFDIKYCILMNNGTSATHCMFKALKYKYPSINKIYIPNNVFIAPWNCGLNEYDISIFEVMKINKETLNIDTSEEYIKSLENNSAVVIVHNLGQIINVPRLKSLRPDIIFIEDNCEGLFGKYNNIYTGTFEGTLCSAVSFYGNKNITTGEGGAFFTNDIDIYKYIKTYYSHGMSDKRYIHNLLGTNYRMTNIQAGFLYDQLNDIDSILSIKSTIFNNYKQLLKELIENNNIKLLLSDKDTESSYWIFVIIIDNINYDDIEKYLYEKNIQIRPIFYDIHYHKHLSNIKKHEDDIFTKNITKNGIMLPSYPELTYNEQKYIVSCINEFIKLNI